MSRNLTTREKVMLLVLTLFLMVIGYWKLYYEPLDNQVTTYQSMQAAEENQIAVLQPRVMQIRQMEAVIEAAKASGTGKRMPQYNNERQVIRELNNTLAYTREYSLSFGAMGRNDYIITRPIQMTFTTGTYAEARNVVDLLTNGDLITQVSDVSISRNGAVRRIDGTVTEENISYTTNLLITYYEMVS